MKLKVKFLKLCAGRPVAILHKKFAEKAAIHVDDRVFVARDGHKLAVVIDIATGILKEDEIALSTEVIQTLSLKEKDLVKIEVAPKPESLELIHKKLACGILDKEEIKKIIQDIVNNKLTESEIAYFISGVYQCGMNMQETVDLIKAIVSTGKKLILKGMIADKHSIGGIPGRTTPIVVSICASTGLIIPKTSSRAITSPAGTADAMETICKVDFSLKEIKKIIQKTNACLVWGGSLNLAPADDKIIQVERLIDIDPEAQLLASIISKKLAVDSKYILIDIPYGKNAKVKKETAKSLEKKFKELSKYFNLKLACSLKETNEPLGNGIGPALEIIDVIKVLRREDSCNHLEDRSLEIAGKLLELTKKAKKGRGYELASNILNSGEAYKKFIEIVRSQKGTINLVKKSSKYKKDIFSSKSGKIIEVKTQNLNHLARIAGCPLDKFSGIYLYKHINEKIKKHEKLLTIYSESKEELKEAARYYIKNNPMVIK